MLLVGLFSLENQQFVSTLLGNYNNLLIVVVPCVYLYFDTMIKDSKKLDLYNYMHFIIPLLFNIIDYLFYQRYFEISNVDYYYYSFFAIYTTTYYVMISKLLYYNLWSIKAEFGVDIKQNQLIKNWSIYFFSVIVIVGSRLIITLFIEINNQSYNFGDSYLWVSAIFWLIVYFKIIISPELLFGYTYLNDIINQDKKSNKQTKAFWIYDPKITIINNQDLYLFEKIRENLSTYMVKVDQFSFNTAAFRDSKFSLTDLSHKLNIPKSHLTFLFKYNSKISFSEYKKIIRIQYGLDLIKTGYLNTNTYESLAKDIGFKSYNTFFVSFKDLTGVTPQDYLVKKNSLKKRFKPS
jgi:AraC-like DNA-binding protein